MRPAFNEHHCMFCDTDTIWLRYACVFFHCHRCCHCCYYETWNEIDSKNWRLCDSRLGWDFSTLTWFLSFYFLIINRVILDFNENFSRFQNFSIIGPFGRKKSEWEDNAWVSSAFIWKYLCNNIIEIKIIWECEHKRELEITSETSCKT